MENIYLIWWCMLVFKLSCVGGANIGGTRQDITLSAEGGYGNILVAIDDAVPEDLQLLAQIQTVFTSASDVLFDATNQQVYFDNVTILVPPSWGHDASWEKPTNKEGIDRARIIVGQANPTWGDTPYTLQPGLCGVEGDYVLFTPNYLLTSDGKKYVKPEKRLVREFAHLKWGLFDEDVPVKHPGTSPYYRVDKDLRPTRCQEKGFFGRDIDTQDPTTACEYDESSMTVNPPTCSFVPDDVTSTASVSLLYAEYITSVTSFCSAKSHDFLAENRQNLLCNKRSAWEVMNSLEDFAIDHKEIRAGAIPSAPKFTFLQRHSIAPGEDSTSTTTQSSQNVTVNLIANTTERECLHDIVCLALDVSGSMKNFDRIGMVKKNAELYITRFLKAGMAVGIISFESVATILANMTELDSQGDKDALISVLPSTADGGTAIGKGLNTCTEMLKSWSEERVSDSRILVLSDGKETTSPSVANVIPAIAEVGIRVDAILYSQAADNSLTKATMDTGGIFHFVNDETTEENLITAMEHTVNSQCEDKTILVEAKRLVFLPSDKSIVGDVHFDATIGLNTTLSFSYTVDIEVEITVEEGNTFKITKDDTSKVITVRIDGQVTGPVRYTITKINPIDAEPEVVVVVITDPIPGVDQIHVSSRLTDNDISFQKDTKIGIYVNVFQKYTPILDLEINAVIETSTGHQKSLVCTDDGKGLDSTPFDGVYTAAFNAHEFAGDGYYSIKITVDGEGRLPGDVSNRRKRCTNCDTLEVETD